MNKQELIEKYEYLNHDCFRRVDTSEVLRDLKQLDEPHKVKIPKFVAEYIEYAQASDWDLEDVFQSIANELDTSEISVWFYSKSENMDTLASAWLYGYEIEKEKRYLVKIKGNVSENILVFGLVTQVYFFSKDNRNSKYRQATHTRNELEISGFGWVFNCPGVEVKEMKE